METPWVPQQQLATALQRNDAFWNGGAEDYPLMWITAPDAKPRRHIPEPSTEEELWTNVDYAMAATESRLAAVHYAGDALPFYDPWFGPDEFSAWLGAALQIVPRESTSWITPFLQSLDDMPAWRIDPENPWWKLYLRSLDASIEAGRGKWATAFPDLHGGIDALSALRGPENLSMDLLTQPDAVHRAMAQLTPLWKEVVDLVNSRVVAGGQGTTNWTAGWSSGQFVCIGHNDFTCMIGPEMFAEFCLDDIVSCVNHVQHSIYHLDGPMALRHLPMLLDIEKLHTIQWIQGDGNPPPSHWVDMLRHIQQRGKAVQIWYSLRHTTQVVDIFADLDVVCRALDPTKLFIVAEMATAEGADAVVAHIRRIVDECRPVRV